MSRHRRTLTPAATAAVVTLTFVLVAVACLFGANFLANSDNPAAPASATVPAGTPITVMTIGDSITAGANSSDGLGYRSFLAEALTARGYTVTIVNASANGKTLDQIRPLIDTALAGGAQPDYMLWNLGTNDWKWSDLAGWPERYRDEVRRLLDMFPQSKALVAKPTLQYGYEQKFRNCNVWITNNTVAPLGPRARTVAMDSIPQTFLTDNVHPGDAGYWQMTGLWLHGLAAWGV